MEELYMKRAAIAVTLACNLKCRLCVEYAPYSRPLYDFSIDGLKKSIDRFFTIVTHVDKFTFAGGEPFLHPQFASLIAAAKQYSSQVNTYEIITNGNVTLNEKLVNTLSELGDKIFILIDNYGPELSKHVNELDLLLSNRGIRHSVRNYLKEDAHCGGWVDFGDLTAKKCTSQSEIEALYAKCAYPSKLNLCFGIVGENIWPCPVCRKAKELGVVDEYAEYINLFDSELTIEDQRKKIKNIYQMTHLTTCAYCNGLCDDSIRFLPAQQLTGEELQAIKAGARLYSEVQAKVTPCTQ